MLTVTYTSCSVSDSQFIRIFEDYTGLDFPPSGKIIQNDNDDAWQYLDPIYSGVIEMDSLDYIKILHEVQSRTLSTEDERNMEVDAITHIRFVVADETDDMEYASYEEHQDNRGRRFRLFFHKNKRVVKCILESI